MNYWGFRVGVSNVSSVERLKPFILAFGAQAYLDLRLLHIVIVSLLFEIVSDMDASI